MMDIIPRLDDWESRLSAYVASTTLSYVDYGRYDCALFADGCFEAETGVSFSGGFKGRYDSLEAGLKLLQDMGFEDHVAYVASLLPAVPMSFARKGDLAVVDFGAAGRTLVVVGGRLVHGPMPGSRGALPRSVASQAFAVGWDGEV